MTLRIQPPETSHRKLADAFRAGLAPEVIRRKGAEGNLPASLAEKIEILVILTADGEEAIRHQALQTLQNWDPTELREVLADPLTPLPVLEFAAENLAANREELAEALRLNASFDPALREELLARLNAGEPSLSPVAPEAIPPSADSTEEDQPQQTTLQKISRMTPSEKIKCALTGSQEDRFILIRDGNKAVARAVIQSPKLSEAEVEAFASMTNIPEEALRLIASNRAFMKSYAVLRALVNNPKTPLDVTLPLIPRLNARDMKTLSVNRNIPDALRVTARKVVSARESASTASYSRKH